MGDESSRVNREFTVRVSLDKQEFEALLALAERERRHPKDQAGVLLRKALIDCGAIKLPEHRTGRD